MEATCSSFDFQRNTRRYIPENRTLHNRSCENLRSYKITVVNCMKWNQIRLLLIYISLSL
jgi:hypothetical protein